MASSKAGPTPADDTDANRYGVRARVRRDQAKKYTDVRLPPVCSASTCRLISARAMQHESVALFFLDNVPRESAVVHNMDNPKTFATLLRSLLLRCRRWPLGVGHLAAAPAAFAQPANHLKVGHDF